MTYWQWMKGPGYRNFLKSHSWAQWWMGAVVGSGVMGLVASFLVAENLRPVWDGVILGWVVVLVMGAVLMNIAAFRWAKQQFSAPA